MLLIRAGIHKLLVRLVNREDPGQTASSVWTGSALFVQNFTASTINITGLVLMQFLRITSLFIGICTNIKVYLYNLEQCNLGPYCFLICSSSEKLQQPTFWLAFKLFNAR